MEIIHASTVTEIVPYTMRWRLAVEMIDRDDWWDDWSRYDWWDDWFTCTSMHGVIVAIIVKTAHWIIKKIYTGQY